MSYYSSEDVSVYISEIRLLLSEQGDSLTDEEALERIESYIFSLPKAQICSHNENSRLIERLFLLSLIHI